MWNIYRCAEVKSCTFLSWRELYIVVLCTFLSWRELYIVVLCKFLSWRECKRHATEKSCERHDVLFTLAMA